MNAIEIKDLQFSYDSKESILSDLNLEVPEGSIFGFLGPNGVGKTTSLKLILNLLKNTSSGSIKIFDQDIRDSYPNYLSQIGSMIEEPSVYDHLSARENLKIWSQYFDLDKNRISEILEIIGLSHAGRKKVRSFSTGMKQRLGLGIALLNNPKILILDEPTNGLDPIGINELRELLLHLKSEGKTILLSSHILSEVEKLVDHVGIINHGTIVYQGTLKNLKDITNKNLSVKIYTNNNSKATEILSSQFNCVNQAGYIDVTIPSLDEINQLVAILLENDIQLHQIIQDQLNLENIFINLTQS